MKKKTKPRRKQGTVTPVARADYGTINAALEEDLDLAWSKENHATIKRRVGPVNFAAIEEIVAFTSNQDAWLNDQNLSSAADKVAGKLSQRYPALSPGAIFKIVSQATYGWR